MRFRRGRYPMDHPPADSSITPAPTLPRRGVPIDAELSRFSPLSAPERETVDVFCRDNRSWALRQARRSYRHLPESLREQAVDRAMTELRTRTPTSLERRALAGELATRLTESLRHVHVGWCLNESSALLRREGTEPVQPEVRREELAHFVDDGLGGLERAVLQLEIGAGRETRTARAALRLHPRQYAQHRQAGFSKLRDAISAQVIGRACDQHVGHVVDAALGDKAAMDTLTAGAGRCRYCAREAQGLRSVLHERLAVAPWPIAIKPAGLVAAKLGAVGAFIGSKTGAGAGVGATAASAAGGSGATMAATVLAAAALATGTAAVVGHDASPRERAAGHQVRIEQTAAKAAPAATTKTASKPAAHKASASSKQARHERRAAHRKAAKRHGDGQAPSTPSTGSATASTPSTTTAASGTGPVTTAAKPVTDTVKNAAKTVTQKLPPVVAQPVQDVTDTVTGAVDDATKTVDKLIP
jgi:hypothetical protein